MNNVMGTKCVGNKLVRLFGLNSYPKHVITETVDGKTITNVFDENGNRVISRIKSFAKEAVGNKIVNTRTEARLAAGGDSYKLITDRIYSQKGELLGSRAISFRNGVKYHSGKQRVNGDRFVKWLRPDGTATLKYLVVNTSVGRRYDYISMQGNDPIIMACNQKGLPMPDQLCNGELCDMTIKEMKLWMAANKHKLNYLPEGFGPKSLNDIFSEDLVVPVAKKIAEVEEKLKAYFCK